MKSTLRFVAIAALVAAAPPAGKAVSLRDELARTFGRTIADPFADVLAKTAARSLHVPAASTGVTYRYDPARGASTRTAEPLGPLFLERPATLGKGRFDLSVSYQHIRFDE